MDVDDVPTAKVGIVDQNGVDIEHLCLDEDVPVEVNEIPDCNVEAGSPLACSETGVENDKSMIHSSKEGESADVHVEDDDSPTCEVVLKIWCHFNTSESVLCGLIMLTFSYLFVESGNKGN